MGFNISLFNDNLIKINLTLDHKNVTDNWKITYHICMIYFYGLLVTSSIGIISNILTVITFIASWSFWRNSTRILLLTLASVDIIGNGVSFIYVLFIIILNPTSHSFHQTLLFLPNGFKRLSMMMMIPISVNRYAVICRRFNHHTITSWKSTVFQITTLAVVAAVVALTTSMYKLHSYEMTRFIHDICALIIGVIVSCFVPLVVSFVLTIIVVREFKRIETTLEDSLSSRPASKQGERNVTRAMIAVNVAFVMLILPYMVIYVVRYMLGIENDHTWLSALFCLKVVSDLNFSVNTFIYTLCLPKFRSTLLGLLTCKRCRKRIHESFELSTV